MGEFWVRHGGTNLEIGELWNSMETVEERINLRVCNILYMCSCITRLQVSGVICFLLYHVTAGVWCDLLPIIARRIVHQRRDGAD